MVTAPHIFITNFLNCMNNIIDLSTECLEAGGFYKCGDYEVIVSKKTGDVYNVVIDKDGDTASCKGLNIEQIKSVLGLVVSGFQEPKWNPTERKDGIVRHSEFDVIKELVDMDIPVYLFGPAGSGKNILCKQIADELGLDFYFSNSITQEYKLTGFTDAGGNYHETEFYKAFTKGGLFFLDELDGSVAEALLCANAAIANRYFDFPNGKVEAHPNFRIISAGNTCGRGADEVYSGRTVIDGATLDRFAYVEIKYDKNIEDAIASGDNEITEFVREMRTASEKCRIPVVLGYRAIERLKKMSSKFTVKQSLSMAVTKGMSRDEMEMLHSNITCSKNRFAKALKQLSSEC